MARVLQVCNTDFYLTRFLAPLVRALVARGHTVACVCEGDRADRAVLGPGVPVHAVPFPRAAAPRAFATAVARVRALIRTHAIDVVASHNRNASLVARIAARLEGVPVNLYTAHGFYFHDDQRPAAHAATVALEAALARLTDFTLSQSAEDVTQMTRRGLIARDRIAHIGNGIDTARFRPRPGERDALEAALGLAPARFRVGAVGRLVRGKGFGDLLAAFAGLAARVPGAALVLIGGNIAQDLEPYAAELAARARALGVADAVTVTGLTDRVADYLATCDAFVLPSYREGLPRALLEAMAVGLPVVATDIRGCREAVTDGVTGRLYPPHDVARLTAMLTALAAAPARRAALGAAARARAVAAFDERAYVARQADAIDRLVGRPAPTEEPWSTSSSR
jgi:glycosyltransferase involved in cell wall biosynthesis